MINEQRSKKYLKVITELMKTPADDRWVHLTSPLQMYYAAESGINLYRDKKFQQILELFFDWDPEVFKHDGSDQSYYFGREMRMRGNCFEDYLINHVKLMRADDQDDAEFLEVPIMVYYMNTGEFVSFDEAEEILSELI